MNTQNESEVVLAFYRSLHQLITAPEFDGVVAEALVATYDQTRDHITLDECTVKSLKSCHREWHDQNADLNRTTDLAEKAFANLAGQMRNPEAQKVCRKFREISGTDEVHDLYVQLRNLRLLGKDKSGPAVVTLVVDSASVLIDLIKRGRDAKCEYTHFSQNEKEEPGEQS